jgi:hypothetical protein
MRKLFVYLAVIIVLVGPASASRDIQSLPKLVWVSNLAVRCTVSASYSDHFSVDIQETLIGEIADSRAHVLKAGRTQDVNQVSGCRGSHVGQRLLLFLEPYAPETGPKDWGWRILGGPDGRICANKDSVRVLIVLRRMELFNVGPSPCEGCTKVSFEDVLDAVRNFGSYFEVKTEEAPYGGRRPIEVVKKGSDEEIEEYRARSEVHRIMVGATLALDEELTGN